MSRGTEIDNKDGFYTIQLTLWSLQFIYNVI